MADVSMGKRSLEEMTKEAQKAEEPMVSRRLGRRKIAYVRRDNNFVD